MRSVLFVVGSITYAIKGRDLLRRNGYRDYVERAPADAEHLGCGYGIYVVEDAEEAQRLLQQAGIRIRRRMERGDTP